MLTKILLRNFKPFGETEQSIDLGKITIFIGPNGAGKSSVLQALELLKQSRGSSSLVPGRFQFSDFSQLVNSGVTSKTLSIGFSGRAKQVSEGFGDTAFTYHATFGSPGTVVKNHGLMRIQTFTWPELPSQINISGQYLYGDTQIDPTTIGGGVSKVDIGAGSAICFPFMVSGWASQEKELEKLYKSITQLFNLFSDSVGRVFVIGAIRGFHQLSYPLGDNAVESPDEANEIVTTFAYRRGLEAKVAEWLNEITNVKISFHLVPNKMASLLSADGYNIYHEGFGTNQLIKPLVQMAIAPSDSLVAIEEAEIHLHPAAQIRLCDTLAEIAQTENKQILLTTHSDHILTGFLNIVAEAKLKPEDLSVCYFEKDKGATKVTKLPVDGKGMIEGGLRGFADVELGKLERHLKALGKRR